MRANDAQTNSICAVDATVKTASQPGLQVSRIASCFHVHVRRPPLLPSFLRRVSITDKLGATRQRRLLAIRRIATGSIAINRSSQLLPHSIAFRVGFFLFVHGRGRIFRFYA